MSRHPCGLGAHNPGTLVSPLTGLRPKEDTVLERCFKSPSTLHRLRGGPSGPFLDGLAQALAGEGYPAHTIVYYVRAGEHLAGYAES